MAYIAINFNKFLTAMTSNSTTTPLEQLRGAKKNSIAVVAHDAGAARLLFSWLKEFEDELVFCVDGPAKKILDSQRFSYCQEHNLEKCIANSEIVISGTGWASNLEFESRLLAKKYRIRSIAVIDHWVEYSKRFERNSITVLPDEIWVSDEVAFNLASKKFPKAIIHQLPNEWMEELKIQVTQWRKGEATNRRAITTSRLLYLSEPIRDRTTGEPNGEELNALDYWLQCLPKLIEKGVIKCEEKKPELFLRLHPSEKQHKYDDWINKNKADWEVSIVNHQDLAESLAKCDVAFGCETQALVAAVACEIPVFSTVLPLNLPCRLPHKEIKVIAEMI
ncbi:hypothetical protein [Synechococcus sp. GEYO]|uniref:hypothetical protein n=1 Tax=Synechococcus sp. GEYO TaxID=2575511 RepID=UPI0010BDF4AE|nr:hypothetical protein [Synechococcus sp. GEYO]